MEQIGLLGHHTDRVGQAPQRDVAHVVSVDADRSVVHVIEPGQQVADRCLPGATRPDQSHQLTRRCGERDILERPFARRGHRGDGFSVVTGRAAERIEAFDAFQPLRCCTHIREVDAVEVDPPFDPIEAASIRFLGQVELEVHDLEHALETDEGGCELDPRIRNRRQRAVQLCDQRCERHEGADRQRVRGDHQVSANPVHRSGADGTHQTEHGEEPTADHRSPDAEVPNCCCFGAELLGFRVGAIEQLHEERSADIEGLLENRRHRGVVIHLLFGDPPQHLADSPGREHEQRERCHGQHREQQRCLQHHTENDDHRHDVGDDRDKRPGDRLLGSHHVVVEPRDELSGLGGCEEGERHALQVLVQLASEVVDDALTGLRRPPPLGDADQRVHDRDDDHHDTEHGQQTDVGATDGLIHDQSDDDRGHDAETGDEEHGDQNAEQLSAVGGSIRPHPLEQVAVDRWTVLVFVVFEVAVPAAAVEDDVLLRSGTIT